MNTPKDGEGNMDSQDQSRAGGGVSAHTPGPWAVEEPGVIGLGAPVIASVPGVEHVAYLTRGLPGGGWPDARLIAAAPDLLVALQFALAILEEADIRLGYADGSLGALEMEEAQTGARAAVSKALGQ